LGIRLDQSPTLDFKGVCFLQSTSHAPLATRFDQPSTHSRN
jgi:hypothetical protein